MKIKIIFFLLIALALEGCSNLLYYPTRAKYVNPEKLPIRPQEVIYSEDTKPVLMAWYFQSPQKTKALILLFHGNAQNVSSHFWTYYWVLDHGYDVFVIDYPGYGGSHGDPTPQNTVAAGLTAVHYAQKRWPHLPLILAGQSLGGNIALRVLSELNTSAPTRSSSLPCASVIESSFLSYRQAGQKVMTKTFITWPLQWLAHLVLSDEWSAQRKVQQLPPIPYLVFHRQSDPVVPFELGEHLFAQLPAKKEFYKLPGEGHVDTYTNADHERQKAVFLKFAESKCGLKF